MQEVPQSAQVFQFGVFEVDAASGELRKAGSRIRLQEQPFRILITLLDRPGEVVSRHELCHKIWAPDTFVDFEQGLGTAIKKLRQALGDDADEPRYIETLPKRGYRFIAQVRVEGLARPSGSFAQPTFPPAVPVEPLHPRQPDLDSAATNMFRVPFQRTLLPLAGLSLLLIAAAAGWFAWQRTGMQRVTETRAQVLARAANPRAVDPYLQGVAELRAASDKESFYTAIASFERSLRADPQYAPGYVGLAEAYARLGFRHLEPSDRVRWKAEQAVARALEIDPGMAQAYLLAGQIAAEFEWNWSEAERLLRRALELEPGNSEFHRSFAHYVAMPAGRVDEALQHFKQAESLDPFNAYLSTEVGRCYYKFRRYGEAISKLSGAAERAPDFIDAHFFLGLAYLGRNEYRPAIAELQKAHILAGRAAAAELAYLSHAVGRSGDHARAAILHAELTALAKRTYVADHYLAVSLIGLGRVDEAIQLLHKALKDQTISGKFSEAPIYDSIRDRPDFVALARQFPASPADSH